MSLTGPAIAAAAGGAGLRVPDREACERLAIYAELLMRWNARLNLSAIRSPDQVLRRHLLEGIFAAENVAPGTASLLDFGSGAGIPGVPIAICRPEVQVTLADSNQKKAAFLKEVGRRVGGSLRVHAGRVEEMPPAEVFGAVTMRAVDRAGAMLTRAIERVAPGGELLLLTTAARFQEWEQALPGGLVWRRVEQPSGSGRVLQIGSKSA